MSINAENAAENHSLPPNVQGKCRGRVELTILEITCNSPAAVASSNKFKGRNPINFIGSGGYSVNLIWWGQSYGSGAVVKFLPLQRSQQKTAAARVSYAIKTNAKHFQNYLSSCESIELKLTACTSNLQVGTAFVKIPKRLYEADPDVPLEVTEFVKIFSPRNTILGEIKLKFRMIFDNPGSGSVRSELGMKETACKDQDLIISTTTPLDTARSYTSFSKQRKSGRAASATTTLSSNVLDYLTGREMTQAEQNRALEEIQNTSPLESVVSELTARLKAPPLRDIYNRIDSLRLTVRSVTVLPAGIRELDSPQLENAAFTVESRISPNLLATVRAKYDFDVMRFYSNHVDVKEKRVDFNRDAIRSIKITPYVDNAYLLFTVWSRPFGSKYSRCLGTAKYQFASLFESSELEQVKKLTIRSCTDKIHVGFATIQVTLGTKGVHFGPDFMTIINDNDLNESAIVTNNNNPSTSSLYDCDDFRHPVLDDVQMPLRNFNNNETNKTNTPNSNNQARTTKTTPENHPTPAQKINNAANLNHARKSSKDKDNNHAIETDRTDDQQNQRLLQGLLYAGAIRNVRELQNGGYFLVCRAFWKEDATSTDFCENNSFNFLEIFPVLNNEMFLERCRNNHLNLELWQKFADTAEQLVGIVKLPLHQFFIAFRDNVITDRLCQAKLPVISIDGWVSITSPLSGESCGQLQALLAIGTEEQLEYLKASRGLCLNRVDECVRFAAVPIPVPQLMPSQKSERSISSCCDAESQTTFDENQANSSTSARRERLSDLLGNFIDNLAQRLPSDRAAQVKEVVPDPISIQQPAGPPQLRKTSDLLDALQKALVTPPTTAATTTTNAAISNLFKPIPPVSVVSSFRNSDFVKVLLEIENALHLPKNPAKLGNKKIVKRNSGSSKSKQSRFPVDEEPSPYVTFQAEEGSGQMVKSHEGMVYATNVVEKSCSPVWNKRFEIFVPADLMTNDEKRFILKVWRKTATDLPQCRLLPTPIDDAIIGFAAIDLNVLLARMPCIAGWFNIVDFNGRINGQIKVNVRPLEDVMKFKKPTMVPSKTNPIEPTTVLTNIIKPPAAATGIDLNNSTLSRAIKRKFTELEEITERLRARLLDVTGENPAAIDEHEDIADPDVMDEQLNEFERDLNTECCDDEECGDEEVEKRVDFGWLGFATPDLHQSEMGEEESDSATSDSAQERIQMISEYLRKTDLNRDTAMIGDAMTTERNPPEGETASSSAKKHMD